MTMYRFYNAKILTKQGIVDGELWTDNGKITVMGECIPLIMLPWEREIDCKGNLLMPSFKNSHAHSPMTFLRSFADDLPLRDWLFDKVFPSEAKLTADDCYWLTKLAIMEYLTSGISVVSDMYFHLDSIANACVDCGFRNVILEGITQSNFKDMTELLDKGIDNLHGKGGLVEYRLGIHAEYTNSIDSIRLLSQYAKQKQMPIYLHLSETKNEVDGCIEKYGITPPQLFAKEGLFDNGATAYHCTHLTEEDIAIFANKNVNVVTCPASNLKLASGIAPIMKLMNSGVNVAIGTDGAASNNSLDMFKEMFLVSGLQKYLNNDASAVDALSVFNMATINGAKAMGLQQLDGLEVGNKADIVMLNLNTPNMQPINNIVKNIVYAGSKCNVMMTMVDGKILYENGEFYINDSVDDIYNRCNNIAKRIQNNG